MFMYLTKLPVEFYIFLCFYIFINSFQIIHGEIVKLTVKDCAVPGDNHIHPASHRWRARISTVFLLILLIVRPPDLAMEEFENYQGRVSVRSVNIIFLFHKYQPIKIIWKLFI